MANESGDSKMKSSSSSAADSYIGSIISLTSKYEIRYEGVLYYLNPQDSTLGLKSVRSYGTEGRKKDGAEIPPSDKVYEFILFRGSDIKDLQVKSSPPSQAEDPIHNDPAIIQSQTASGRSDLPKSYAVSGGSLTESVPCMEASTLNLRSYHRQSQTSSGPLNLPKASAVSGGSLTESCPYMEASALNLRSYPNVVPSHHSGAFGPSQNAKDTNLSSHAMLNPWPGYNVSTNDHAYARHQPIPASATSVPTLPNFQEVSPVQAPTNIGLTSSSNLPTPMAFLAASNSIYPNTMPTLTLEQLSAHSMNSLSSSVKSSLPVANQLNMPLLHASGQNGNRTEAPHMFTDPSTLQSAQSLSYSASSLVDSASGLLKQSQPLLSPELLSQPRLSELSSAQNLYPNQRDMGILNSAASTYMSTTPAAQAPLLPPQPSAQQYTEEFDFDAMNEKFKKDEVWGYLGKAKQRDRAERIEDNSTACQTLGKEESDGVAAEADSKPAYNKDEFFDTISCNTTAQRARNGQNRFPERMRHDNEQRFQPGYGGYLSGRGHHHDQYNWGRGGDQYNWGRGYNSGGRGRGGYPRWY